MQLLVASLTGVAAVIGLLFAWYFHARLVRERRPARALLAVADRIEHDAETYVHRQYAVIGGFGIVIFTLLAVLLPYSGWHLALGFLTAVLLAEIAGYISLQASLAAGPRMVKAAENDATDAIRVAATAGGIAGLATLALVIIGLAGLFVAYRIGDLNLTQTIDALAGFGLGAALVALVKRIGGGIFAKVADIGEHTLANTLKGVQENDPNNPASIADNVGDNTGDTLGAGAGLFATYAVAVLAAMQLAMVNLGDEAVAFTDMHVLLPLIIGGVTLLATLVGVFVLHHHGTRLLRTALAATAAVAAGGIYLVVTNLIGDLSILFAVLIGFVLAKVALLATAYFTAGRHAPVRAVAAATTRGVHFGVLAGVANGFQAAVVIALLLVGGALSAFALAGMYGVAIAAVSMLSLGGMLLAMSVFGVVADNATGIAEMGGAPKTTLAVLRPLDEAGNTIAAVVKSYLIIAAGLTAIALFALFFETLVAHGARIDLIDFSLRDPAVLTGVFVGAVLPLAFAGLLLRSVVAGTLHALALAHGKHDFAHGLTTYAQRHSVAPTVGAILVPIAIAWLLGQAALGGVLIGVVVMSIALAVIAAAAGSSWDNAKKLIENGRPSAAVREAASITDLIGDPLKDAVAPSLIAMLQVILLTALVLATVAARWTGMV